MELLFHETFSHFVNKKLLCDGAFDSIAYEDRLLKYDQLCPQNFD